MSISVDNNGSNSAADQSAAPKEKQFTLHQGRIYEVKTQKLKDGMAQGLKDGAGWIGKKLGIVEESKTINQGQHKYKVVNYKKQISLDNPIYKVNKEFKEFVKNHINPLYNFKNDAATNRRAQTVKLDTENIGFDLENQDDINRLANQIKSDPNHPYRDQLREEAGALYMAIPLEMTRGATHQGKSLMLYIPPQRGAICFNCFDSSGNAYISMHDFTQAVRPFVLALQSMDGDLDELLKGGKIIGLDIKEGMFRTFDSNPNKGFLFKKRGKEIKLEGKIWKSIRDFSNTDMFRSEPKNIDDNKPNLPRSAPKINSGGSIPQKLDKYDLPELIPDHEEANINDPAVVDEKGEVSLEFLRQRLKDVRDEDPKKASSPVLFNNDRIKVEDITQAE